MTDPLIRSSACPRRCDKASPSNAQPKFALGNCLATPGALRLLEKHGVPPATVLQRHQTGDWGDVCADDGEANDRALETGARLFSVYRLASPAVMGLMTSEERRKVATVWCITEASRAATTLLRPDEY